VGCTNSFWTHADKSEITVRDSPCLIRKAFFSSDELGVHMSSKGTIKRIVSDKGFGFVADDGGQEYFFHQSACQSFDSLREGQAVTFQTGQGPKGPRAENVREA
jgi:CspA family cold shock protein